jgi:hypothetical protein
MARPSWLVAVRQACVWRINRAGRRVATTFAPVALSLLLLAACASTSSVPTSRLSVSGNTLLVGTERFAVRGAVDYVLPFYDGPSGGPDNQLARITEADFEQRDQSFAAMRADGINTVRIPVGLPDYTRDPYGLGGPQGYLHRLEETVHSADQAGLKVVISWWDSLGWGSELPDQYKSLWPMMAAVVGAVGHDPNVMFEPYNEPNGIDWATWTSVMNATLTEWRNVLGYHGVLILDTTGYSWNFSPGPASTVQVTDRSLQHGPSEVIFANHRYPNGEPCLCGAAVQEFDQSVGNWTSTYPILGTEYGVYSSGYPSDTQWMSQLLGLVPNMEQHGFNGAILFVWNWVDPNSLSHDPAGHLTSYGEVALHELWKHD